VITGRVVTSNLFKFVHNCERNLTELPFWCGSAIVLGSRMNFAELSQLKAGRSEASLNSGRAGCFMLGNHNRFKVATINTLRKNPFRYACLIILSSKCWEGWVLRCIAESVWRKGESNYQPPEVCGFLLHYDMLSYSTSDCHMKVSYKLNRGIPLVERAVPLVTYNFASHFARVSVNSHLTHNILLCTSCFAFSLKYFVSRHLVISTCDSIGAVRLGIFK